MRKIHYLIIALLCAVAQGAWAQTNVGTADELRSAIDGEATNITLTADITVDKHLTISREITINLGSYIESSSPRTVTSADGTVSFKGIYDPVTLTGGDKSSLYLGVKDGKSALFYPAEGQDRTINSFRAYFHVDLSSGSQTSNGVRAFVLNFGDNDETTDIVDIEHGIFLDEPSGRAERNIEHSAGAGWYDLSGRKLQGKPTAKGIYIYKGKKVIK